MAKHNKSSLYLSKETTHLKRRLNLDTKLNSMSGLKRLLMVSVVKKLRSYKKW